MRREQNSPCYRVSTVTVTITVTKATWPVMELLPSLSDFVTHRSRIWTVASCESQVTHLLHLLLVSSSLSLLLVSGHGQVAIGRKCTDLCSTWASVTQSVLEKRTLGWCCSNRLSILTLSLRLLFCLYTCFEFYFLLLSFTLSPSLSLSLPPCFDYFLSVPLSFTQYMKEQILQRFHWSLALSRSSFCLDESSIGDAWHHQLLNWSAGHSGLTHSSCTDA